MAWARVLKRLEGILEEVAAGRGGILLVSGEVWIGKSRLLSEFGEIAGSIGMHVVRSRFRDAEGAPAY